MNKNKYIVKAVALLPEELLTDAIVEAAAATHNPELLEHLPARYRTPEIIRKIFEEPTDGIWCWSLSRIPEEYRSYDICLQAVKNKKENFQYVPVQHRRDGLLLQALTNRDILNLLPLVPAGAWNRDLLYAILKRNAVSVSHYHRTYEVISMERTLQVILTFVPRKILGMKFYMGILQRGLLPAETVRKITPRKFHTREFLLALVAADYSLVAPQDYDRELFRSAILRGKKQACGIVNNKEYRGKLEGYMDEEMADRIVTEVPAAFRSLPKAFRTSKRLLLAVNSFSEDRRSHFNLLESGDTHLLTREICMAIVRKYGYDFPHFPVRVWSRQFVDYCMEHCATLDWLQQVPRHLISWKVSAKVCEGHAYLLEYLPKWHITPERARTLYRRSSSYMRHIPQHYLRDFSKYTGLPAEFYGGQIPLSRMKENREDFTYCRIGTTYIGLYKGSKYRDGDYRIVMTRALNRYVPAETVFDRPVGTFHKTWLEKLVADHDPRFSKPKVDASLRDVQALGYYGVEHLRRVSGASFYRNTFMGETVGYCIRKAGVTYHDDKLEALVPGWRKKWEALQKSEEDIQMEKRVNASYLHSRLGICKTGIAAFAQDYGLDPKGSYTIGELRERVQEMGYKPSLSAYRWELQRLHII